MGNCINRSSSAATAQNVAKPEAVSPCDERTIESSSIATISPPGSPLKQDKPINEASQHTPSPPTSNGNTLDMEQQREEGQERLRELVITGANAGDIDWKSIIALAEDLHRKEQQLLRSHNQQRFGNKLVAPSSGGCSRRNISRRQAFFEKRRRQREISRRRKLESVGSFSVNLSMYEEDSHCRRDLHSSFNANDESCESDVLDPDDRVDVFEDDDPSPLYHDISHSTSPFQATTETERRPGTPAPFIKPRTTYVDTGSFLAATSLFDSAKDNECSSNSSSDSSASSIPQGENWALMTIDEDATVTDW
mmetsp:Transcript_10924/g.19928  ORF Transcript_10924/g.19928 Transcript_10924/m.19928 type:complete len:308 (-) Transcript_10924:3164-4087(-)